MSRTEKMSKRKELSVEQRAEIIALHNQSLSQVKVAKKMKCSRCAVQLTLKRFRDTKQLKKKQRIGRKRATTQREDRLLV